MFQIYSKIITDSAAAGAIYTLARGLDSSGKGWVRMNINIASNTLNVSPRAVWQRCKLALSKGYFLSIEKRKDIIYVKYKALKKINRDVNGLVASTTTSIHSLSSLKSLRVLAYTAAIISQQERSNYSLSAQGKKVTSICLKDDGSLNAGRCNHFSKQKKVAFFKPNTYIATASLLSVGNYLGRARSTLSRYAKNLPRIGVFVRQFKNALPLDWQYDKKYFSFSQKKLKSSSVLTLKNGSKKIINSFQTKEEVYRRMPNHYLSDIQVNPLMVRDNSKEAFENTRQKEWKKTQDYFYQIGFKKALQKLSLQQLIELGHSMMLFYKGQSHPMFNDWSDEQLRDNIYNTIQSLESTEDQEALMIELVLRILNPANVLPLPFSLYSEIEPNFNENTLKALANTRLSPDTAPRLKDNSMFTAQSKLPIPPATKRVSSSNISQYLLQNCTREQIRMIANYAQLVYADSYSDISTLDIHSLLSFIESLTDNNYQFKKKSSVIKDMVKRLKKFKKPLAHHYVSQLVSHKNFPLFS